VNPEQLLYAETHEWVDVATDGTGAKVATVGLSAFAVEALTDLVFIELPELGRQVTAGESFGEIESVKAVSDIYSPVSGEVVAVNDALTANLQQLAEDPFGKGWIVKIKIADESSLSKLVDHATYQKQCAEEDH